MVLKVQVELRTSVIFFFAHKRKRQAEVNKTVVWLFHLKKQNKKQNKTNKQTRAKTKKAHLVEILPTYAQNFW